MLVKLVDFGLWPLSDGLWSLVVMGAEAGVGCLVVLDNDDDENDGGCCEVVVGGGDRGGLALVRDKGSGFLTTVSGADVVAASQSFPRWGVADGGTPPPPAPALLKLI